jgi:hypothetical protein
MRAKTRGDDVPFRVDNFVSRPADFADRGDAVVLDPDIGLMRIDEWRMEKTILPEREPGNQGLARKPLAAPR